MDWPKVIKEVLEYHSITQYRLGKMTGVSKTHINHLMLGKRKDPSFTIGLKIINLHPNKWECLK